MSKQQLLMLGLGVLLAAAPICAQQSKPKKQSVRKTAICHHAKGKHPGNKSLRVRDDDVSSHLAHGDTLGACPIQ
jgi:hypothetical protein